MGRSWRLELSVASALSGEGKEKLTWDGIVRDSHLPLLSIPNGGKHVLIDAGVVITDPPLKLVNRDKKYNHKVTASPFRGGYPDFIPLEEQMKIRSGPPRVSMLDDICFYLVNHSSLLDCADPESVALFVRKIVASHYHQLIEFLRSTVSSIQWSMSRQDKLDIFDVTRVRHSGATFKLLNDVYASIARISSLP